MTLYKFELSHPYRDELKLFRKEEKVIFILHNLLLQIFATDVS